MRLWLAVGVAAVAAIVATGASGVSGGDTLTAFAGTGTRGFSGDGGPAISAQLNQPFGVAVDAQGNVYIADTYNNRVRKVTRNGMITTIAGSGNPFRAGFSGDGGPATSAQLGGPLGVAVDAQGNIYIADAGNWRVRKVSSAGTITTIAGTGKAGSSGDGGPATSAQLTPYGVAVDAQGNVYIADANQNRVRKVSPGGTITTFAGTGSFFGPLGDGGPATSATLNRPKGVAVDTQGNVYIADTLNDRARKVSPGGTITTIAGTRQPPSDRLLEPQGVAVDGKGSVYIADTAYDEVVKVSRSGKVSKIAGLEGYNVGCEHELPVPALEAYFREPVGIAVDGRGDVYIADYDCDWVRKIIVRTAPTGGAPGAGAPIASPPTSTTPGVVAGRCSKATAVKVATRLHVGVDPVLGKTPVFGVLCGPFLGRGSQAMVAEVAAPTGCGGPIEWAVFRLAGGAWRLVMKGPSGAFLSKVGSSDIRERVGAPRPGDARCSPSAWKSRIWHWNGKRLVPGPWRVVSATKSSSHPTTLKPLPPDSFFKTPSGNIVCQGHSTYDETTYTFGVFCTIRSGFRTGLPVVFCPPTMLMLSMGAAGRPGEPHCTRSDDAIYTHTAAVLDYGKSWSREGVRCTSALTGLTCRNKSGHGFFLSRERWRKF